MALNEKTLNRIDFTQKFITKTEIRLDSLSFGTASYNRCLNVLGKQYSILRHCFDLLDRRTGRAVVVPEQEIELEIIVGEEPEEGIELVGKRCGCLVRFDLAS